MKLIVGLGNPGEKYKNTRHNVGFIFISYLASLLLAGKYKGFERQSSSEKHNSIYDIFAAESEKLLLIKPQTFMNDSGLAVRDFFDFYKTALEDLFVIHDDLDIPLGQYKIQKGVGPKLHNGIESIENHLGTKEFWRVRIGVENRSSENRVPGEKYVLQDFTQEEMNTLKKNVFDSVIDDLFAQL